MTGIKYNCFEDEIIMDAVAKNGGVFDKNVLQTVKRQLPERSNNSISGRWYSYLKEEYEEQKTIEKLEEAKKKYKKGFFERLKSWIRNRKTN